jgi:hypothetical protein
LRAFRISSMKRDEKRKDAAAERSGISKHPWSPEADETLLCAVGRFDDTGEVDWNTIVEALGRSRTKRECMRRYITYLTCICARHRHFLYAQ